MKLEVSGLESGYGQAIVVHGITFEVQSGEIVSIIGSNGAGKTTTLKTIVGLLKPASGTIVFQGEDVTRLPVDARIRRSVCLLPEGRQIFYSLTVQENLLMGAVLRSDPKGIRRDLEMVYDLFPEIKDRKIQRGGTLSGGEQQMLAIGRGLMSRPRLLLIDELSLGLAPVIVDKLVDVLKTVNRAEGISIVLVEQDVEIALEVASRGYVMENGRIVAQGTSSDLLHDEGVRAAYLGI